jgi:phosphopantetheine adenylyltransferase
VPRVRLSVFSSTCTDYQTVDKIREENNLPALRTFVIDVISAQETSIPGDDADKLKVAKMSSTAIRQWIADNPDTTAS